VTATLTPPAVRVETLPPRRVAFLRHVGPFSQVGSTFQRLFAWAGQRALLGPAAQALGICHDDPDVTSADKLRYDCCVTVADSVTGEGDVGVQTLAGGEYVVVTHRGPYEKLPETWRWLYGTWLPTSGREPADGPPFEVYRNSPADTAPEALLTDVCVPLAPR
jgi:AraC family transcriptional regulator